MAAKKPVDMTKGPIVRPLIFFILPLIGGSVFQQLYNTVDFIFVGNYLNSTAAAAVGASSTLINCTIGLFTGISVGTSVVAANAIGAKRPDEARKTLHTSVTFGLIGGLIMMTLGIVFAPAILQALNTPSTVMPQAITYMRIYLISLPMLVFYNMLSGSLRAEGDSSTPFKVLVICGLLNVLFDFLFIVVIPLGVAGVAIASTVTQALSALFVGFFTSRKNREIRFSFKELRIDTNILRKILKTGLPTGIQTIVITISNVFVQYFINGYGETPVAAFAVYYKVENLIFLTILAFGQASVTFAGQNMGAGNYKRLQKGTVIAAGIGMVIVTATVILILSFPTVVFRWFIKDGEVMMTAISLAMVSFPFYWIYPLIEVFGGAIRAMGYSLRSMVIVIANFCVLRLILLTIFSTSGQSVRMLAAAYPITWATSAICFVSTFFVLIKRYRSAAETTAQTLKEL
ncbi:MAG: MATE family efflux transporter [Lachnospiraceae bacterium]|nr:MATE family efflux transporter [Lachnospiraceae bacterium]